MSREKFVEIFEERSAKWCEINT